MQGISTERLVRALYQPTLVLRDKTALNQFDMVPDIMGEDGPLLVPVITDTEIDQTGSGKVATIKTIYGKPVVRKSADAVSTASRIRAGQLVFADTGVQEKGGDPKGGNGLTTGNGDFWSDVSVSRSPGTRDPVKGVVEMPGRSPEKQKTKLEIAVLLGVLQPSQETALKSKKSTSQ